MLKMELSRSGSDFSAQMKEMHQLFEEVSQDLMSHSFKVSRDKLLLTKQVERLKIFIKEMELHLSEFQNENALPEEDVLFIFERQHIFKNIYRKHMSDFASIID